MKMNIIFLGTDSIMKFYFQTLFYNLLVFEYSLVHIFWQGLNMFFFILFQKELLLSSVAKNASRLHNDIIIRFCALKTYNAYLIDRYIYVQGRPSRGFWGARAPLLFCPPHGIHT